MQQGAGPQAPGRTQRSKWASLAPLLAALPMAFKKGGQAGAAALMQGFQSGTTAREEEERGYSQQNWENERANMLSDQAAARFGVEEEARQLAAKRTAQHRSDTLAQNASQFEVTQAGLETDRGIASGKTTDERADQAQKYAVDLGKITRMSEAQEFVNTVPPGFRPALQKSLDRTWTESKQYRSHATRLLEQIGEQFKDATQQQLEGLRVTGMDGEEMTYRELLNLAGVSVTNALPPEAPEPREPAAAGSLEHFIVLKTKQLGSAPTAEQVLAWKQEFEVSASDMSEAAADEKAGADAAFSLGTIANQLLDMPNFDNLFGLANSKTPVLRQATANAVVIYDALVAGLQLDSMGIMKGVLTEADMKIIRDANVLFDRTMEASEARKAIYSILKATGVKRSRRQEFRQNQDDQGRDRVPTPAAYDPSKAISVERVLGGMGIGDNPNDPAGVRD